METVMVRMSSLCLLAALALAPPSLAGDLQASHVSSQARWVAHVDIAGIFGSDLLEALEEAGLADLSELEEVRDELGIDPREDLRGLTVYGGSDDPEDAIGLIHTTSRIETALARVRKELTEERVDRGGLTIHRWTDDDGDGDAVYSYLAQRTGSDERIMVISPDPDGVVHAVEVLRGESDSLVDGGASRLGSGPSPDALVYVSTGDALQSVAKQMGATSHVLPLARSAVVEIGESAGRDYIDVKVATDGGAESKQIVQVISGAQALASIMIASEPEAAPLQPLLAGLRVEMRDDVVHLRFEQDVKALVRLAMEGEGAGEDAWDAFSHKPQHSDDKPKRKSKTDWQ